MRTIIFAICLIISFNAYAQDGAKHVTAGTGGGLIHYPEGKIYGFAHNYYVEYLFSTHFGARLSLDLGEGQNNEKYYFDFSKSVALGVGLVYVPLKKIRGFNVNSSFIVCKNTRILGTKDEIISNSFALSKFTSYEKTATYGLSVGISYPIIQMEHFLIAAKMDAWASWLQMDALSLKLIVGYTF